VRIFFYKVKLGALSDVPVFQEQVALLDVWKAFEETHGTEDNVAKVQGLMAIVSKWQHVNQETGQTVEGINYIS
jgi:hypothetical protein